MDFNSICSTCFFNLDKNKKRPEEKILYTAALSFNCY